LCRRNIRPARCARNERRLAVEAGTRDLQALLDASASSADIAEVIRGLPADDAVSGIMLQLPLPGRLPSESLIHLILPEKDIDGFTTASVGLLARGVDGFRSSTPSGVMALIDSTGVDSSGADALVVAADRAGLIGDVRFGDVRCGSARCGSVMCVARPGGSPRFPAASA